MGIAGPPTSYSALYFTNPAGLPSTMPSGRAGLDFSFAIHNATQSANGYRWTIQSVQGAKTLPVGHGVVTVPASGTRTERAAIKVVCPTGTLEIVVRLASPAESIDFRAACGG